MANFFVPVPRGQAAVIAEGSDKHMEISVLLENGATPTRKLRVLETIVGACRENLEHAARGSTPGCVADTATALANTIEFAPKIIDTTESSRQCKEKQKNAHCTVKKRCRVFFFFQDAKPQNVS
jgi:hypothetical protein